MNIGNKKKSGKHGQSLIEILVALGIGVILIGGVTALISVNVKTSSESKTQQAASSLTQEVVDAVRSKAEADWGAVYVLQKTSANKFYIASSTREITAGTETLSIGGYAFTRYFYLENTNRENCGTGAPTAAAETGACHSGFPNSDIARDPSTQKVTVVVEWAGGKNIKQEQYISRTRNAAIRQTDWNGGGGDNSVLTNPNNRYSTQTGMDTTSIAGAIKVLTAGGGGGATTPNIDATEPNHWAWNDVIGWIDFGYAPGNVGVNNDKLFGYASSSVGLIAFDCATSPSPTCTGTAGNWRVSNVGAALKGWAYNDTIGWISFDSVTATSTQSSYGVTIAADGSLNGYAWNDVIGWISFNCANGGACEPVARNYKVKTSWTSTPDTGSLTSPIFDLGWSTTLNSIIWKGLENGGAVRFQIAASSNATGPWNDADYKGPDGTAATSYVTTPNVTALTPPTILSPRDFANVRYVRYKILVESNPGRTDGPEIQDVIISYGM